MSLQRRSAFVFGSASALALVLGSTPALSLTAEEMWQDWVSYYESVGQTVTTGAQAREGDTLVIKDATFASGSATAEAGSFSLTIPEMRLQDSNGGTVIMTMSDTFSGKIVPPPPEEGEPEGPKEVALAGTQSGLKLTASGSVGDTRYEMVADSLGVSASEPGANNKTPGFSMTMGMTGLTSTTTMKTTTGRDVVQDFSANGIDFSANGTDPENGGTFEMTGKMGPSKGTGTFFMPTGINMEKMDEALVAGLRMQATAELGAGEFAVNGTDEAGKPIKMSSTGEGSTFKFSMDKSAVVYDVAGGKSEFNVETPDLPVPVTGSVGSAAVGITLPWGKADAASDAAVKVKLVDVTVSDGIWDMFDPTKQLPRDPATLVLDLTGKVKMDQNLYDPALAESEAMPGTIEKLDIAEAFAKFGGADLTATGGVTFDNAMGMPMPLGAVTIKLNGANGLMDKLAAMGAMPADALMGVKAMLGVFGKPVGEDAYESLIEFKEGMQIFANGVPIPMGQ